MDTVNLTGPKNMRVLLADDDARIGKHVRQALIAEGYAVDYAQDGDEAHWLAENNPYDAIIHAAPRWVRDRALSATKGQPDSHFMPLRCFVWVVLRLGDGWDGQREFAGPVIGGGSEVDEVLESSSHSLC